MEGQNISKQKFIFGLVGLVLIALIVVVSIVRDRIVTPLYAQITVMGEGKVAYTPDMALVTLGVRVMKVPSAETALNLTTERMAKVIASVQSLGIPKEDIQTQNLSLYSEYDYKEGVSTPSGYTANQQVAIKVRNLNATDSSLVSKIITESSKAGANEVVGVSFDASNLAELKQQARLKAIEDAKKNAPGIAEASGIRIGKIIGWYENTSTPFSFNRPYAEAQMGGGGGGPSLPSGIQEVVVEIGLNYKVK